MNSTIRCILIGIGLGAAGVASAQAAPIHESRQAAKLQLADFNDKGAYTKFRWIGLRDTSVPTCPPVVGWEVAPLMNFQMVQAKADDIVLAHELGLDRFCVYTADANSPQPFPKPAGVKASMDRMALSGSAGELERAVAPALAERFLQQAGGATPMRLGGRPQVRLAILDSQPDGDGPPVRAEGSQHGYTLAHLAQELVCPSPDRCVAQVATRRVFNYDDFDPARPLHVLPMAVDGRNRGGRVGAISDLAPAIVNEVARWRASGDPEHLVLNLSLGWDGEGLDLDARSVEELDFPVRAVYQALRFAAQRGALVIAAAGNRRGGPSESDWPLLPAAWEARRPSWLRWGFQGKLVYAVGGVDWQGLPLPNSRVGGRPRLVAYGDHAVAAAGGELTPIYTGSSVSTAVVSSIAAAVWHLRPELRPAQVMRLVGCSGERLEARSDFYPWKTVWPLSWLPGPRMQQAYLSAAVTRACAAGGARCAGFASRPVRRLERRPLGLSSLVAGALTVTRSVGYRPASPSSSFIPPCDPMTRLWTPAGPPPSAPCPADQFSSLSNQRWLMPQPEDDPCPSCSLYPPPPRPRMASLAPVAADAAAGPSLIGTNRLGIEIGERWAVPIPGARVIGATLDINCYVHGRLARRQSYPISTEMTTERTWAVAGLVEPGSLSGCTAQLNFAVEKDGRTLSVQNPVLVDP